MGDLIFLTGPVRSGKSRRAVDIATAWGDGVAFVATYRCDPADAEMAERVRRHQAERPAGWRTLEAPATISAALAALDPPPSGVVIDSLVLWLADRFDRDEAVLDDWSRELALLRAAPWPVVVIGDEIGWSPVPIEPALRRFRDLAGFLGQRTAAAATEAWLMVAGCQVRLK
ncbi:MAG: bifunctional adenosylcobinamide kinase/adenosylcobinamide-phosphate guanylyltransferase [Rhodoplanes sp.]|uniref:bifunctional adenosylcobinamide kinase/adenosylcobinamide-phosphate guanylyltransferase n=1 Tax=Rhodoplanes sp. TaxID=1968906 RepID=UPI0017C15613|nr:bifunctional adenosylcobinamide kinase/adenosylcobinamide-phosphate guanylyltransferase [Rhodoplanes sp.]NVO16323.1 bifunctional adenosylcobinamide kinase/adenosylcobinamide-phosphate guanylyltransferase [Rhodoplanes sp.]